MAKGGFDFKKPSLAVRFEGSDVLVVRQRHVLLRRLGDLMRQVPGLMITAELA